LAIELWAATSLLYIPGTKLEGPTIPYILTAKEILGQPGRVIIGVAIISEALALVNGLLLLLHAAEIEKHSLRQPSPLNLQRSISLLVCATIACLMAGGLAGDETLDYLIKAANLLWLFLSGFKALSSTIELIKGTSASRLLLFAPVLLLLASSYLLATTAEPAFTLKTLLISLLGGAIAATAWIRLSR
jgi:hypothetical protein